jgi:3',5'-cyclic AMP phosphodiesterase CpdA
MTISRRDMFAAGAALGLTAVAPKVLAVGAPKFRFVHFTDPHIQPELRAGEGVAAAVKKLLSLKPRPDFVLLGGDHVMDILSVTRPRANLQFDMLAEALKPLEMPTYSTVGNHDVYGWSKSSPIDESDPLYGKKMMEERVLTGPSHYAFQHKGWDFVILDSIQASGKDWTSAIDDTQLTWLADKLNGVNGHRTVVLTHVPLFSIYPLISTGSNVAVPPSMLVANAKEVQALLQKAQVRAVLQGHTHVIEACTYGGTEYITGGAVSGSWWKGPNLGIHPEGFMVYDVHGDKLTHEYVTYGWKATV